MIWSPLVAPFRLARRAIRLFKAARAEIEAIDASYHRTAKRPIKISEAAVSRLLKAYYEDDKRVDDETVAGVTQALNYQANKRIRA